MEQAPTHHMERPRRGVRNLANARAAAQAAPAVRVSGPVRTQKATRKNTPYARASKNKANNISRPLQGLSFGKSSFKMKKFNKNKAAQLYAPNFAPSGFVPLNAQQAFQSQMNQNIAAQSAANAQHLANVAARRSLGAKKAAATRKARKEAAEAALRGAMENVREAEQVVVAQQQSSSGVSANAERALANAQRAAQNADRAFHRALLDIDLNENNAGPASAASASSAASANNLSSMFGRL
jgi:hypothetical protein